MGRPSEDSITQEQVRHTPGPWQIAKTGHEDVIAARGDVSLTALFGRMWATEPDMRLVAAAPDLYSALTALLDGIDWELLFQADKVPERAEEHLRLLREAEVALEKADGQPRPIYEEEEGDGS